MRKKTLPPKQYKAIKIILTFQWKQKFILKEFCTKSLYCAIRISAQGVIHEQLLMKKMQVQCIVPEGLNWSPFLNVMVPKAFSINILGFFKGIWRKASFHWFWNALLWLISNYSQLLVFQINPMPTFLPGFRRAAVSWGLKFVSQILEIMHVSSWGFYETAFKNLFLCLWYCCPVKTYMSPEK